MKPFLRFLSRSFFGGRLGNRLAIVPPAVDHPPPGPGYSFGRLFFSGGLRGPANGGDGRSGPTADFGSALAANGDCPAVFAVVAAAGSHGRQFLTGLRTSVKPYGRLIFLVWLHHF